MSVWTEPRAYIIGMTGAQTRVMHQAAMLKAQASYLAFLASLSTGPAI